MSQTKPIYLDYNATTPIHPTVIKTMLPYLTDHFGNPSSSHIYGRTTKLAVENARRQVAEMLRCKTSEVVFTSGGSESNNYAIKGIAFSKKEKGNHLITSCIEHPSVKQVFEYLKTQGFKVTYLNVDSTGIVDLKQLESEISEKTILISIMHANNEVGTIQPLKEICKIAKKYNITVHTDASQSIGKIPVHVDELDVDLLTVCSHKFYGPKGVGALYIRNGVKLEKLIHGASHENGLRAGTENILEVVGLGAACELVTKELESRANHMKQLRERLHQGLIKALGEQNVILNGHKELRLPNTLSVAFPNIPANILLSKIENEVACSAGSACHSDLVKVSDVLMAMKIPEHLARGTLRLSTGMMLNEEKIDKAINVIVKAVKEIQSEMKGK